MTQRSILFIFLLMLSQYIHSQKTSYNIKDFGAVGNGETICTIAINSAIEKCSGNGGGMVVIPAGKFKSGTILMKSNVELHLEMGSTLLASTNPEDFPVQPQPGYRYYRDGPGRMGGLIYAEGISNIAITGFGMIDGNGSIQKVRRHNILLISCKQVRIEGIRMFHAGTWNQHYLNCEDVVIDRIQVYNHANHNNDAMDIDGCRRVVLSNSIFDSTDDGIVLKSTGKSLTEDVVITNCIISTYTNAIKCGTESTGGFRNISISNCVIRPSRCKTVTWRKYNIGDSGISLIITDGGVMEGVSISNITIEGTLAPIFIRLANRARPHPENAPEPPVGKIRNITISNITAYNTDNFTSSITAIPGHYIENVTIDNIQLFNQGGVTSGQYLATHQDVSENEKGYSEPNVWGNLPSSVFFIRHVKGLSINNLTFGSKQDDPRIPIVAVDVERIRIGKSIFSGPTLPPFFILLDRVKEFDVEKPLGWGQNPVIKP